MPLLRASFQLLTLLFSCASLSFAEILATPSGAPLSKVAERVANIRAEHPGEPVTVTLADGIYFLNGRTLELGPDQSGAPDAPVVWRAAPGAHPVIHAGRPLGELNWKPDTERPGVWKTVIPAGEHFEQLYHDGARLTLARYPNAEPGKVPFLGAVNAIDPARAKAWSSLDCVYVHALTSHHWGSVHFKVTGVDAASGKIATEGGWQINRPAPPKECFVEGPLEELDAPGEWAYRATDRMLFLMPPAGKTPATGGWTVDGIAVAVSLRGDAKHPAHDIALRGLTFTGTARTFMETREPLLLGDWCVARKAAVLLAGTERCEVADSVFAGIGGNAVLFSGYNRSGTVARCDIHDAGAGGVYFIGLPSAVRNPRFKYGRPLASKTADRTPGPLTEDYPKDCRVSDCLIHDLGLWEKQVAAVNISMASGIVAERNSVFRIPRAAFNINDGTWGGHRIEGNDAWDTVRETHDHGTFNSWGRDRYWQLDGIWNGARGEALALVKSFAGLDAVAVNTLRGNRFDCRHGWGIDLDDGSSNYLIENNLVTAGGIKLREGFFRTMRNNIVVGDTLHPHVWYRESGDSVTGNIFGKVGYANIGADLAKAGGVIDRNLFFGKPATESPVAVRKAGTDKTSVIADPLFVDAAAGDYRVRSGSPALTIGFKNFPQEFGSRVREFASVARGERAEYLKTHPIAGTGEIVATGRLWGAEVSEITEGLRSASGLPDNDGLYLVAVPAGSPAARLGLTSGSVLRLVNGGRITRLAPALEMIKALKSGVIFEMSIQNPVTQSEDTQRAIAP